MWDQRYDSEEFAYGTEPNAFLAQVSERIPTKSKVLMLADGEGRNGVYLAGLGHDVTSVDSSSVGLKKAESLASDRGVTLTTIHADLADFDLGTETWDAIVAIFAHVPPGLRKAVHPACVTALKPGGAFILEAYTPEQLNYKTGGPPVAEMMMTVAGLGCELDGLTIEHGVELVRDINEGTHHFGEGAVVQVVGVKPS